MLFGIACASNPNEMYVQRLRWLFGIFESLALITFLFSGFSLKCFKVIFLLSWASRVGIEAQSFGVLRQCFASPMLLWLEVWSHGVLQVCVSWSQWNMDAQRLWTWRCEILWTRSFTNIDGHLEMWIAWFDKSTFGNGSLERDQVDMVMAHHQEILVTCSCGTIAELSKLTEIWGPQAENTAHHGVEGESSDIRSVDEIKAGSLFSKVMWLLSQTMFRELSIHLPILPISSSPWACRAFLSD